jgi:hypothetical protein
VKGAGDILGEAVGGLGFDSPFAHAAEHFGEVHFLPRVAVLEIATDLTREEDHRGRVFKGDVNADGGVRCARRARHESDAGTSRHPADGVRHHRGAALMSTHRDLQTAVDEGVENGEIAFARHTKDVFNAIGLELSDERRPCDV